jgi:glycosyltransferase involved in cell wall biosynthesis
MRVVHYLGNVGMTGVESFVLMLVAAQRRAGLEPSIACAPDGREELIQTATRLGVPVWSFPSRLKSGGGGLVQKMSSLAARGEHYRQMVNQLRTTKAAVLHLHPVGIAGLEALLAAQRTRIRTVFTHHATLTFFAPLRTRLSDLTFTLEKRFAHKVALPYAEATREMAGAGMSSSQLVTIPFCVDLGKFHTTDSAPPRQNAGRFRLLISARMVEGKGHRELLEAFAKLLPRFPNLELVIAGGGPLEGEVRAQIARLGVEKSMELVGHQSGDAMPTLMRTVDAIVLPSYMQGETFPITLLEGMALGLPAIGTRWFGIPDIIEEGVTGLLVKPRDVTDLANALERLVTDPEGARAMGRAGQIRARERYSADVVAKQYAELYRS